MTRRKTRAELDRLLHLRNHYPDQVADIDAQIQTLFTETHAILVLDMTGFSRLTAQYGIIHFLALVQRLSAIAHPLVNQHHGTLVKQEADNLYAVFPKVHHAVDAATAILKTIIEIKHELPDCLDLYASIGIGYGDVLMIEGTDLFGHEMNLASKLGEDLARPNEILLTQAAYDQLRSHLYRWEKYELSISGLQVMTYKLQVPATQSQ